jgi:hypothetical protein
MITSLKVAATGACDKPVIARTGPRLHVAVSHTARAIQRLYHGNLRRS